ncbi:MAG: winged helix-turn-helix transcriptional regulator [Proteobacteria bacterium]|nr:winged helix-turn-helix transcriptional regulator [Pseudomonadota bacterium]MBI3499197.1 winged helix-turn-helix transcriptional regulator [Pseudomonadota bacterium]
MTGPHAAADLAFKALSDPIRLKILDYLMTADRSCCAVPGHVCACDIEKIAQLSQPTVSHHMKCLQQAGLVAAKKSGRWMYYSLSRAAFAELQRYLAPFADDTPTDGTTARAA